MTIFGILDDSGHNLFESKGVEMLTYRWDTPYQCA
jgi:hypothetical protein